MVTRRDFIRTGTLGTAGLAAAAPSRLPQPYFGLHPFIEQNPKAGYMAAEYCQVESPRHVPNAVRQERARPGGASLCPVLSRMEDGYRRARVHAAQYSSAC